MLFTEDEIKAAKILIVDDQKLHTFFLEKTLKGEGFKNIKCVTDSKRAISEYHDFLPDLLLLDLLMPHIDGFQVMDQLADERTKYYLPILVFSEEKSPEIRLRALETGASDYLTKPYESGELLFRIRNLIETRILHLQVSNQNKALEKSVDERTKDLNESRLEIIQRLAEAAECRDNDTGKHIIRMSHFCQRLSKELGLTEKECELILNSSPLHDIGKIGIPDSILLKPGKLTEQEFEIMKTHTTIGAKLLAGSNSKIMKMAETIALTHHEKWDGTGYPNKLKGNLIPLVGQICSICDVFDALTSKRPYKKAWSVDEAMKEIKAISGKHFNPITVDAFIKILPDIKKIKKEYTDG